MSFYWFVCLFFRIFAVTLPVGPEREAGIGSKAGMN